MFGAEYCYELNDALYALQRTNLFVKYFQYFI